MPVHEVWFLLALALMMVFRAEEATRLLREAGYGDG